MAAISLSIPFLRKACFAELEEARESLTMWYQTPALQKLPHLDPIPRTLWLGAALHEDHALGCTVELHTRTVLVSLQLVLGIQNCTGDLHGSQI